VISSLPDDNGDDKTDEKIARKMLEIDDKIVSLDVLCEAFCCDLSRCRGACCVEGESGAPLSEEEVDLLEEEYDNYKPYMTAKGVEAIQQQGFMVVDSDNEYTTPLIAQRECAYSFEQDGVTLCAIERAYREGHTAFVKPVSCHLYPIRVTRFRNGSHGLVYHRWDTCHAARESGSLNATPLYRALREPLVRRFGEEFYRALEAADEMLRNEESP